MSHLSRIHTEIQATFGARSLRALLALGLALALSGLVMPPREVSATAVTTATFTSGGALVTDPALGPGEHRFVKAGQALALRVVTDTGTNCLEVLDFAILRTLVVPTEQTTERKVWTIDLPIIG